jgi:hypothetical protein
MLILLAYTQALRCLQLASKWAYGGVIFGSLEETQNSIPQRFQHLAMNHYVSNIVMCSILLWFCEILRPFR